MSDNAGTLLEWRERQYLLSAAAMLRAVSATELVKVRRHFGQTIRPAELAQFYFRFAETIGRGALIPVSQQNRNVLAYMLATPPRLPRRSRLHRSNHYSEEGSSKRFSIAGHVHGHGAGAHAGLGEWMAGSTQAREHSHESHR